jgi:hypothetical protein
MRLELVAFLLVCTLCAAQAADYRPPLERCRTFDEQLMVDLSKAGGEQYAQLCAPAYRQTVAGKETVADANGKPLVFPRACFSNGCMGTVDMLFPQAPFLLVFSPGLTKATLVPILDYSARWAQAGPERAGGALPRTTGGQYVDVGVADMAPTAARPAPVGPPSGPG